jgi:hypothetical protein
VVIAASLEQQATQARRIVCRRKVIVAVMVGEPSYVGENARELERMRSIVDDERRRPATTGQ